MPVTLSLAMIVRDEAPRIERVLAAAREVCEEMIVVDTGSTDGTPELASRMGAVVSSFEWVDDFAAARNASFERCSGDWILVLDADDLLPPETIQLLHSLKANVLDDQLDVILGTYEYLFDETGRCTASYARERLYRRQAQLRWQYPVHESVRYEASRAAILTELRVVHRSDNADRPAKRERNKRIIEQALAAGDESAQLLFYQAIMLFDAEQWLESYRAFEEFIARYPTTFFPYDALIRLAYCASRLGGTPDLHPEAAARWARRAVALDPERAEGYMRLAQYHIDRQEWALAIPLIEVALSKPRTTSSFLFDRDYTWAPWDQLAVCHAMLGHYHRAMECGLKAIRFGNERERIKANLLAILERL